MNPTTQAITSVTTCSISLDDAKAIYLMDKLISNKYSRWAKLNLILENSAGFQSFSSIKVVEYHLAAWQYLKQYGFYAQKQVFATHINAVYNTTPFLELTNLN